MPKLTPETITDTQIRELFGTLHETTAHIALGANGHLTQRAARRACADAINARAKETDPALRVQSTAWLLDQIEKLAKGAAESAREDAKAAENDSFPDPLVSQTRAECETHYAQELRRILAGKTWDEAFVERAQAAELYPRRRAHR
jgi:hypothetical protein